MTRFVFISDTHLGATPMGYEQQKGYPQNLSAILKAFKNKIQDIGDVDFILHGGDMTDFTSDENILEANKLFDFDIPLNLCLGNHDVTKKDALNSWLEKCPHFFQNSSKAEYTIKADNCLIHVVPNQWEEENSYYWGEKQEAHFAQDQIDFLESALKVSTSLPHFILTHSPVFGVPKEQTGTAEDTHVPYRAITESLLALAKRHANLKCVMTGHTHVNMNQEKSGLQVVTTSSFAEAPFDFKLFEVSNNSIKMKSISLGSEVGFDYEYNNDKSYVQGREEDRSLNLIL